MRAVLCQFLICFTVSVRGGTLLCTDFETNPATEGWTTNGVGMAEWTTNEAFSGDYSITCSNGGTWLSPMLNTTPLQWYRLSFKSLAPGVVDNPGSIGYAYWAAQFFEHQWQFTDGRSVFRYFPVGDLGHERISHPRQMHRGAECHSAARANANPVPIHQPAALC